jgi:retron-type reverse transcriptase
VLDAEWARTGSSLGMLVRYADDFIVLCTSRARAEQARRRVGEILAGLGLQLHPDKTRIARLTRGHEGFDFLVATRGRMVRVGSLNGGPSVMTA